jgi:hypothetical protein
MIFDLKYLSTVSLKKFDGTVNYFNPSGNGITTLYRKEVKYGDNLFCESFITDGNNDVILSTYEDDEFYYSYEDARMFDDNKVGVHLVSRPKKTPSVEIIVKYCIYDSITKELKQTKTQNGWAEKHWQLYKDKIIYHVNPFIILDSNESILYSKEIDWSLWIERYGKPGLSTNIFTVDDKKYLLYHSFVERGLFDLKYYVGLLRLTDDLQPMGYYIEPFFEGNRSYVDLETMNSFWKWKETKHKRSIKCEIVFPMSVVEQNFSVDIYAGLNDCESVKITVDHADFVTNIKNKPFILCL